jgi:hypothetical protein
VLLFFALSCLAAAALGSVVVYQKGAQNRLLAPDGTARLPPKSNVILPPRPEPTLETLQLGDAVLEGSDDYVVVGTLAYREEGDAWSVHVLDAGASRRYLEVRSKRGVLSAALLDVVDDAPIHGQLGSGLTYRGRPLTLEARGDARITVTGDTAQRNAGLLKYARYTGPGGAMLIVEEEGTSRRALYGQSVPQSSLTIYPHA